MSSRPALDFREATAAAQVDTNGAFQPATRSPILTNGSAKAPEWCLPSSTVEPPGCGPQRLFHEGIEYMMPPKQAAFENSNGVDAGAAPLQVADAPVENIASQQEKITLHLAQEDKVSHARVPTVCAWHDEGQLAPPPPTPTPSPPPPPPEVECPTAPCDWPTSPKCCETLIGEARPVTFFDKLLDQLAEEHRRVLHQLDLAHERVAASRRASKAEPGPLDLPEQDAAGGDCNGFRDCTPHSRSKDLDHLMDFGPPFEWEFRKGVSSSSLFTSHERCRFHLHPDWEHVKVSCKIGDTEPRHVFEDILEDSGNRAWGKLHQNYQSFVQKFIAVPGSPRRLLWDSMGALLLCFDIIAVPMLVFAPPQTVFTRTMDWITMLFWTCDMGASLFVGYIDHGTIVMNPGDILKNYLKTWFLVDCVTVGPDWAMMMLEATNGPDSQNSAGKSVKLMRMVRFVRVLRLMRLTKLRKILALVHDHLDSEYMFVVVKIVKLLLFMVIVNHFLGCLWYLVGVCSIAFGDPSNWIDAYSMNDRVFGYQYTTSVHWALTQFTPGSMHVQPQNTGERMFAITVLLMGMVIFSSFISSMTAATTQLRGMQEDTWKQFWLLRRYLRQEKVPNTLAFRIQRFVEFATTNKQDMVNVSQVKILDMLSDQLHLELRLATALRPMLEHPLFGYLNQQYEVSMQRLCAAMDSRWAAAGDYLFYPGDDAKEMLLLASGEMKYSVTAEDQKKPARASTNASGKNAAEAEGRKEAEALETANKNREDQFRSLEPGDWIGEHVLWIHHWSYVGTLVATGESELVTIERVEFTKIALKQVEVVGVLARYAKAFLQWVNDLQPHELIDVLFAESGASIVRQFLPSGSDRRTVLGRRKTTQNGGTRVSR